MRGWQLEGLAVSSPWPARVSETARRKVTLGAARRLPTYFPLSRSPQVRRDSHRLHAFKQLRGLRAHDVVDAGLGLFNILFRGSPRGVHEARRRASLRTALHAPACPIPSPRGCLAPSSSMWRAMRSFPARSSWLNDQLGRRVPLLLAGGIVTLAALLGATQHAQPARDERPPRPVPPSAQPPPLLPPRRHAAHRHVPLSPLTDRRRPSRRHHHYHLLVAVVRPLPLWAWDGDQ